jgi:uracil-DNA glycosylase family 4
MKPFFNLPKEPLNSITAKKRKVSGLTCLDCGLFKNCKTPKMKVGGLGKKNLMVWCEAPGKDEDEEGTQLVGECGQALKKDLKVFGADLHKDFFKINSVNCRPENNKTPNTKQINCCRSRVFKSIKDKQPKKILLMGNVAIQSFLAHRYGKNLGGMYKWNGCVIPDQELNAWVFITYHPSFLLRNPNNTALHNRYRNYLKQFVEFDEPFPSYYKNLHKNIEIIKDADKAIKLLEAVLLTQKYFYFDFEATGKKLHRKEHDILSIAFSTKENKAYAMPMFENTLFRSTLKRILTSKKIFKIAQNIKYEDHAVRFKLGYQVKNWGSDTMLDAHVLDNRQGITGLKYQTYINFGVLNYDGKVKPYMESYKEGENPDSNNAINRLDECPIDDLLHYNGLDVLFGNLLLKKQLRSIKKLNLKAASQLTLKGAAAFAQEEANGIKIDTEHFKKQTEIINSKIQVLKIKMNKCDEIQNWIKAGNSLHKQAKYFVTDDQLRDILFNIGGLETENTTAKGKAKVDENALELLKDKSKLVNYFLKIKKLNKLKTTYIDGIVRETVNGVLRPNFNLHIATTYRSSMSDPNGQNIPERNEKAKKIVKTGIIPSPGHKLKTVDYGGHEFNIAASVWEDPKMIEFATDPTKDVHQFWTKRLYKLTDKSITKDIRFHGKNSFLFATLYGKKATYDNNEFAGTGFGLWQQAQDLKTRQGQDLIEHLQDNNCETVHKFIKHVAKVEAEFLDIFKVYNKAKKKAIDDYNKKGYIELVTGFRVTFASKKDKNPTGLLTEHNILNSKVQGPAFHCLLLSNIILIEEMKGWNSKLNSEIHDENFFDADPAEDIKLNKLIKDVMINKVMDEFKWILVPLTIEMEESEINGNWYNMKEVDI